MAISKKHETPQIIKDKLKADFAKVNEMRTALNTFETNLQDVMGAYILGAGLPQQNIKFDDDFNLVYEVEDGAPEVEEAMYEDEPEALTASAPKKPALVRK